MVILGLVGRVVLQSPDQRFMQFCIMRYVPRSPFVKGELRVDPLISDELPSGNERQPFCRRKPINQPSLRQSGESWIEPYRETSRTKP